MAEPEPDIDDDDEVEPLLKYSRIGLDVAEMLTRDSVSCIRAHEKFLVIGTQNGFIYILDLNGNEIKRFYVHSMPVNEVSVDVTGEFVCSCSDDGLVVVNALYTEEHLEFSGQQAVKTVAIDPDYVRRDTRELVMGGGDGQLNRKVKGWFGNMSDVLLHNNEGPILAIRWEGEFIAWANSIGVKVYDCNLKQRITHLKRPQSSLDTTHQPQLCWANGRTLLIGWADSVQAVEVRQRDKSQAAMGLPVNYVTVVCQFTLPDAICCGIAPHGQDLAVLCHVSDDGELADECPRPELRVLDRTGEELSCDALSMHGYETCTPNDYRLDYIEVEKVFYVTTTQDVIVAKERDADDSIHWLLEQGREKEALETAQRSKHTRVSVQEVGSMYLHKLTQQGKFYDAAAKCNELLGPDDAELWDRWIFVFAKAGQLAMIAHYIPTDKPRLRTEVYEMVLSDFVKPGSTANDHSQFLDLLERWPKDVYRMPPVINLVREAVRQSGPATPPILSRALAKLYELAGQHARTLDIYLYMYKSGSGDFEKVDVDADEVFEYIEKHHLHNKAVQRVAEIVVLDADRGIKLLIRHATTETKDLYDIVEQLKPEPLLLHKYLRAIFDGDMDLDVTPGYQKTPKDYHDDMVGLFADHEPERLESFLRKSTYYNVDLALELCRKRKLPNEVVFLLGRTGRDKDALNMILDQMNDIDKALKFVKERKQEELWEMLIDRVVSESDPNSLSKLLDTAGSHIDPILIIERIPAELEIPDLRDKIVKIIRDYTASMSLNQGCARVLKSDNVGLCHSAAKERTRAGIWEGHHQGQSASAAPATRRDGEGRWTPTGTVPMAAGARGAGSATWYFHADAAEAEDEESTVSSPTTTRQHRRVASGGRGQYAGGGSRGGADRERARLEQSHRRVLGSRGAGLFYYSEGGVQDRLRGPGFDAARGSIANAVLGLKPLDAGASKDIKRAERGEIARLAGWEGRLQAMEEQRARDRDLGPPPLGLGGASAAAPSPPPPVVGVPSPPVALSPRGAAEMDAVAKADALVRGDSVYSELASKYRSV